MKVKTLPADWWMLQQGFREDTLHYGDYSPVAVRFGRPGIYLEGKACWFEADSGAWSYDAAYFKYCLAALHATELDHRKVQALRDMVHQRLATKVQVKLYRMCLDAAELKKSMRSCARARLHVKKQSSNA